MNLAKAARVLSFIRSTQLYGGIFDGIYRTVSKTGKSPPSLCTVCWSLYESALWPHLPCLEALYLVTILIRQFLQLLRKLFFLLLNNLLILLVQL
jgi:hypothetical protein